MMWLYVGLPKVIGFDFGEIQMHTHRERMIFREKQLCINAIVWFEMYWFWMNLIDFQCTLQFNLRINSSLFLASISGWSILFFYLNINSILIKSSYFFAWIYFCFYFFRLIFHVFVFKTEDGLHYKKSNSNSSSLGNITWNLS